jgi:hypothetical protein
MDKPKPSKHPPKLTARNKRAAKIEQMAALPPINTSMAILAARGGRPVNGDAVKAIKRMGPGSQVRPKRSK